MNAIEPQDINLHMKIRRKGKKAVTRVRLPNILTSQLLANWKIEMQKNARQERKRENIFPLKITA
jgi:hypothetical protein